jgi:hypothetical protein
MGKAYSKPEEHWTTKAFFKIPEFAEIDCHEVVDANERLYTNQFEFESLRQNWNSVGHENSTS